MPVDYSKWDALELSDDSDFEPHPNVDKRSFIRAKQAQIHQQRADRKNRIETLKYERLINVCSVCFCAQHARPPFFFKARLTPVP